MVVPVRLTRGTRFARAAGAGLRTMRAAISGAARGPAAGQSEAYGRFPGSEERKAVRAGQIGIVTAPPGGTCARFARALAALLGTRSATARLVMPHERAARASSGMSPAAYAAGRADFLRRASSPCR